MPVSGKQYIATFFSFSSSRILSPCRLGYSSRCIESIVFGSPVLDGGQAQYVRVPKAGGTLFNLSNPETWTTALSPEEKVKALAGLHDSSLLLLADILPTGMFAALQAINHPKLQPMFTGIPWPLCLSPELTNYPATELKPTLEDRILTIAIIGLGPVGICAAVSLVDVLATRKVSYRIIAVDRLPSRREKMMDVFSAIGPSGKGNGVFNALDMDGAKAFAKEWTGGLGCNAVLEVGRSIVPAMIYESSFSAGGWTSGCVAFSL